MGTTYIHRLILGCQVIVISFWVQFSVWTRQVPNILDTIEAKPRHERAPDDIEWLIHFITGIAQLRFFHIRKNCLKKNLLYYYFLVTSGITDLTLHIGVQKPGENLEGHCWLTLSDKVYLDAEENVSTYTTMYSRGV